MMRLACLSASSFLLLVSPVALAAPPDPTPEAAPPTTGAASPPRSPPIPRSEAMPSGMALPPGSPLLGYAPAPAYGWVGPRLHFLPADVDAPRYGGLGGAPAERKRWYGWQTLIGVGISDILIVTALISDTELWVLGAAGHVATGPTVHFAHGHIGKGFLSLGLNAALPIAGAFSYAGIACDNRNAAWGCAIASAFIGGSIGLVASAAIDIAALSTETVEPSRNGARLWPRDLVLVPMLGRDQTGLSLGGRF